MQKLAWVMNAVTALVLWLASANAPQPFRFSDDFSKYPAGSVGEPNWETTDIGFEIRNGMMHSEVAAGRGYAILKVAPMGRSVTVEATLTVYRAISTEWKIAGIGVFIDERNYWHIALVESPDKQGRMHFAELHQMLDGVWLSDVQEPTRLTTEEDTGGFDWEYGRPYRLRIALGKGRVIGEVFDADGKLRYRCIRRLDNRAVTFGRPFLTCGGFVATFDDVSAEVSEIVPEPKPERKTYPPFISRLHAETLARLHATGFFRTQQINGVWWLIDPNGYPTLSIGTDHVSYFVHWCEKLGYAPYHENVKRKYGSEEAWAKEAVRRLLSWNFNVLGANNSVKARYQGLAHTEFLAFGSDFASTADIVPKVHWTGFPDVFDPRFERFCDLRAKQRCAPNKDDPWLLGYFLDNELEWWGKSGRPWGMAEEAWKKPKDRACKQALVRILREFYRDDIKAFNTDFGTNFTQFDDLLASQTPSQPLNERGQEALMAFVREAAERYFRITAQAIRKHDPNHLNLGCRFAWDAPEPAWEMAGKYCDIVTVNLYPRIDLERGIVLGIEEHLRKRYELCRKPIIVTEWSFPALDAKDSQGRPLPCKHGAGMRVDNQTQKARCYAIMQRTLFLLPFIVGSHYFMWVDEPALGISSTFPEDSNYGLVNEADEPYPELTAMATKVNAQMFALHSGMTAELSAVVIPHQKVMLVNNMGKVAATFTLALWVNGKRTDRHIELKPKSGLVDTLPIDLPENEAVYIRAVCDPEDEVPEQNEADNVAEAVSPPKGHGARGTGQVERVCAVAWNPTERTLRDVPVSVPLPRAFSGFEDITVSDAKGNLLPSQVSAKLDSVIVLVKELKPYSAVTLWLSTEKERRASRQATIPFAVHHAAKGEGYTIETPKLLLIKDEPDGDAFDRILLRDMGQGAGGRVGAASAAKGIELGSFTPLIWQVVAGQNLWVRPDKVERIEVVEVGPARLVVDIVFVKGQGARDEGQVITEVGAGGKFEPIRAEPQPFRCAYRFTFFPDQPFFLSQCLWVENTGKQAWQWRGYYHYTLSRIGGDSADDEVGGPNVPNYWLQFASWRDPKLRLHYGIIPLREDERLGLWFWKDEGGNQHPDCHRRLEGALRPRQRWQPKEPEPIVAVFGAFETDDNPRPWSDLIWWLRSWTKIGVKVF
jgi:agarase